MEQEHSEAMKVKIEGDAGAWGSWWYICPKCHEQVDYKQKTCDRCGEVLDWNDQKEGNGNDTDYR